MTMRRKSGTTSNKIVIITNSRNEKYNTIFKVGLIKQNIITIIINKYQQYVFVFG